MGDESTRIAIAIVENQGAFLIGRRPAGRTLAGLWEFPGGSVEDGESAEEAAIRECWEEAGLRVSIRFEYPDRRHTYDYGPVHLRFFACRLAGPGSDPREPFQWVARHRLREYSFPPANADLLQRLTSG